MLAKTFHINQLTRRYPVVARVMVLLLITTGSYGQFATEKDKIVASDRRAFSHFGYAVSMSDGYAIVGTFSNAYIFEEQGDGTWKEVIKLRSPEAEPGRFGRSLLIHGRYAFVGAATLDFETHTGSVVIDAGAVFVFYRDESGLWVYSEKLVPSTPTASGFFGHTISASGDIVAIGSEGDSRNAGAVFLFALNANGEWTMTQRVTASDRPGYFGKSVSVGGRNLLVGASASRSDGTVYYFAKGSDNVWREVQKITAPAGSFSGFGRAIHQFNGSAVISNEGEKTAHIFEQDAAGQWQFADVIQTTGSSNDNLFGGSVSSSDNMVAIGAPWEDEAKRGAVYLFKRNDSGKWPLFEKVVASIRSPGDEFGHSISLSNNKLLVGSYLDEKDEAGENWLERSGSAYIFEIRTPRTDVQPPKPRPKPVEKCPPFIRNSVIPNVITPNGDNKNECFRIFNLYDRTTIFICDRYGNEVYRDEDYNNDWCGGTLPPGIYYWTMIQQKGKCSEQLKGWVHILRSH